jgi:hypothetical protein
MPALIGALPGLSNNRPDSAGAGNSANFYSSQFTEI